MKIIGVQFARITIIIMISRISKISSIIPMIKPAIAIFLFDDLRPSAPNTMAAIGNNIMPNVMPIAAKIKQSKALTSDAIAQYSGCFSGGIVFACVFASLLPMLEAFGSLRLSGTDTVISGSALYGNRQGWLSMDAVRVTGGFMPVVPAVISLLVFT